jgi:hypothetical protein
MLPFPRAKAPAAYSFLRLPGSPNTDSLHAGRFEIQCYTRQRIWSSKVLALSKKKGEGGRIFFLDARQAQQQAGRRPQPSGG